MGNGLTGSICPSGHQTVTVDRRGVFWGKQYSALCINGKYINIYISLESLYNWLHVCVKIYLL